MRSLVLRQGVPFAVAAARQIQADFGLHHSIEELTQDVLVQLL
ncbi:MAG: hypothetical protein WDM84_06030 [Bauldia sp.]